jgi:hypothetical protein
MWKHYIERGVITLAVIASTLYAIHQNWSPAMYFLGVAAAVDFDDWSSKRRGGE